jgi:type II secretory ATPase GspE/PulE/Tfp pilus assembly ATPase PilB-like protein
MLGNLVKGLPPKLGGAFIADLSIESAKKQARSGSMVLGKAYIAAAEELPTFAPEQVLTRPGGSLAGHPSAISFSVLTVGDDHVCLAAVNLKADLNLVEDFRAWCLARGFVTTKAVFAAGIVINLLNGGSGSAPSVTKATSFKTAANHSDIALGTPEAQFWNALVNATAQVGGSDIHIEPRPAVDGFPDDSRVRVRFNGILVELSEFKRDASTLLGVMAHVYTHRSENQSLESWSDKSDASATLKTTDAHVTKDGELKTKLFRGRIQTKTLASGLDFVMRMLPVDRGAVPGLDGLGYLPSQIAEMLGALRQNKRMICLAGRVGSGKSFTMRSLFAQLPPTQKKYGVEDPIEFHHANTSQIAVVRDLRNEDGARKSYKAILGAIKRLDPDAILLGETRDSLTAGFVRDVTVSGHLIITSGHYGSALGVLQRFCTEEFGLSASDIGNPDFMGASIYQTLVPRVCKHCAFRKGEALERLGDTARYLRETFRVEVGNLWARNEDGCDRCRVPKIPELNGYDGREVVAEVWRPHRDDYEDVTAGPRSWPTVKRRWQALRADNFMNPDCTGRTVQEVGLHKCLTSNIDPRSVEMRLQPWEEFGREFVALDDAKVLQIKATM